MTGIMATIAWPRDDAPFIDNRYSRLHSWEFDGGQVVPASSSPHIVPVPMSDPTAVDPEEAFVASISSCHMLWFLSIAAKRGFIVDEYRDAALGTMGKNREGKLVMTDVELRPFIKWGGLTPPTNADVDDMHHQAHEECFIANCVKTNILIRPLR